MKGGLVICGPDVGYGPLALLSGAFEEKVQKAASLGYAGVELMVRDPAQLDWVSVKRTLQTASLEMPQIVTGELFGADGLCLATNDLDIYQRALQRTKAVIDFAASLNAMVNIGRLRGRLDLLDGAPDPWEIAVERLNSVVEYAIARDVKIVLEPINRYETDFILTVNDGLRMISDLGADNVGLMLDLFHMNIEEDCIEESLIRAGAYLWHVHIADSQRRYPGSGHLNFAPIFQALKDIGYDGFISAEILPLPDPDTAAQKTIDFLKEWGIC